ncbi:hypothetical protein L3Y34_010107 [Caenorhabditis briggsae]|uniref:Uncharacterized protein n=1 Tax=Caenorhabditis briggsae TaxID=6238 RepID=A0AAE9D383_CAEBR|nr:hypothetical protein L3Y34_010107 [Caenorhabditis briggsae]
MKTLLILCLLSVGANALFGFGESKTTKGPKISLGSEIAIPHTDDDQDTGEIVIPFNDPSTTTTKRNRATTTVPVIKVGGIGLDRTRSTMDVRGFTSTMNPRFTAATKRLPSSDRHPSSGCPNRIDAYTFGPDFDYAFYESTVYKTSNNRIAHVSSLSEEFPDGPRQVNGALYDPEREMMWLVSERSVYGYKEVDGDWKLQSVFPKELPSSVGFTPDAAVRWHNKHQILLSNGGKFALYDEYWNKSLMTGRTDSYFENLPDRVRGISAWNSQGNANIFTQSLVFVYNSEAKKVTGDGVPLGDFWRC